MTTVQGLLWEVRVYIRRTGTDRVTLWETYTIIATDDIAARCKAVALAELEQDDLSPLSTYRGEVEYCEVALTGALDA